MKSSKFTLLLATTFLLGSNVLAGDGFTPDEAFQTMLKLEGTWVGEGAFVPIGQSVDEVEMTSTTVSFKNIGNSTVVQTFAEGTPAEMVSMYHQNGKQELIHTHYCAIGNQPSMAFVESGDAGVIDFKFTHGTNMDVNSDAHAHHSWMRIIDENTYETRTENWANGEVVSYRVTTMKRVK